MEIKPYIDGFMYTVAIQLTVVLFLIPTTVVDLPEETPQVGDVLKVESNKDGVLSLGYYRAAKELKNKELTLDPEYYLEILNQNTIKIQPVGENKTYTCKPNQIDSVLTIDNL